MNVRRFLILAISIATLSGACLLGNAASAQDPFSDDANTTETANLFGPSTTSSSTSSVRGSRMSVSELRQARALYRANQRVARLENNLWLGHEPLRPKWNAVPMMTSRYAPRTIYVPVYIWPR
jgi:hypothetical protein